MKTQWDSLPHFDAAARPSWKFDQPSSSSGQGLGRRLIEVHDHIREETRKLLAVIGDVIEGRELVAAARSALEALSLRQHYPGLGGFCTGYCELLTIHHTLEDRQVFPGLATIHPGLKPVLKQLYAEHEVVAELIKKLDEVLAASARDEEARQHLERVSAALADQLLSHLVYEESQLVTVLDSTSGLAARGPIAPGSS
jgi:hypothetical protein